ncbi:MAG: sigma-54-dependent Fis family transcriptional regulator [Calditrichaeota bacterium]|nr:MAG: sigma-54-dependent Fis family transcriptional regulator [Calditrichota bacterium]
MPWRDQLPDLLRFTFAYADKKGIIRDYHSSFLHFTPGYSDLRGEPLCEAVPELLGMESVWRAVLKGKTSFELPFINKQNATFTCQIFPAGHPVSGLWIVFRDVTALAKQTEEIQQKKNEIRILQARLDTRGHIAGGDLIGESPAMQKLKQMITRLAQVRPTSVLLQGETGTGKSTIARVIHQAAHGSTAPFVEINCAALPENLLEAELFGSVKGAYTHAVHDRKGLVEEAHGGTLFLDEISELSLPLQTKLLTFLETRRFRPLGSNSEKTVETRLIAASNKDLQKLTENGTFREDLFYRLNVVPVRLPALRELDNDIILLADHFVAFFNRRFNKSIKGFTSGAYKAITRYTWPGNIRELSNCIERAMIFKDEGCIETDDLVFHHPPRAKEHILLPENGIDLQELEKKLLLEALEKAGGNKSRAARLLNLTRDTLRYRLEKYNIDR